MHPVLERVNSLFARVLRPARRPGNSELRGCRIIYDVLPAELRPVDEIILVPMTFGDYVELLSISTALEGAKAPTTPQKGSARAADPTPGSST